MVLFILCVKGDLEGISTVSLAGDANICVSVRNPLSDYETRERVVLNPSEHAERESETSREPPCHLALKWEGSRKRSTLTVLNESEAKAALKKLGKKAKGGGGGGGGCEVGVPRDYGRDDSGEWAPILALECRGLEPYAFHPMGGEFVVTSEGGAAFDGEDVDLEEGDWADYDQENDLAVSISEFESKFVST